MHLLHLTNFQLLYAILSVFARALICFVFLIFRMKQQNEEIETSIGPIYFICPSVWTAPVYRRLHILRLGTNGCVLRAQRCFSHSVVYYVYGKNAHAIETERAWHLCVARLGDTNYWRAVLNTNFE